MAKALSEMTLEELWRLFPILLTAYRPCWKDWYAEEAAALTGALPGAVRISHIGSTAIGSIQAKPIVDILAEMPADCRLADCKDVLIRCGYLCMAEQPDSASFNKGYTVNGFAERVFHLHLRYAGNNDELYFRDYLTEHPDTAKEYEALKLKLWKEYEYNRDGYTDAKTGFVKAYTEKAKLLYGSRYQCGT